MYYYAHEECGSCLLDNHAAELFDFEICTSIVCSIVHQIE